MSHPKIILVGGPTASGKSAFALDLARKQRGTIINADAMQVYEGLPILTNQPDEKERGEIPHELYGVIPPTERSSAGKWLALAQVAIRKAVETKRTPILVGGTGLYFRALLGGLDDIPSIPEKVRATATQLYDALGEEKFRAQLAKDDPASAAKLARNDRQRLIRAYEVVLHTGKPIGNWHKKGSPGLDGFSVETHLLLPDRAELYAACDQRFVTMMQRGALDEVKAFLKRKIDPELPAAKTIGVRELTAFLEGKLSREQAITKAQQATRNYAKRQMTWFRNQWANPS